jgi:hypothetical protein
MDRYDDDDEERESQSSKFLAMMMQNMQQQSAQNTQMLIAMMQTMVGLVQNQPKQDDSKYVDLLQQSYSQNVNTINTMSQKMLEIQTRRDNPTAGLDSSLSDLSKNLKAIKSISEALGGESTATVAAAADDSGMWGAIGTIAEKVGPSLIDRFLGATQNAPQTTQSDLPSPNIPAPADQLYGRPQPQQLPQAQHQQVAPQPQPQQLPQPQPQQVTPQPQPQPQAQQIGIFRMPLDRAIEVENSIVEMWEQELDPEEALERIPAVLQSMLRINVDKSDFMRSITDNAQNDVLRSEDCVEWLTEIRDLIY